MPSEYEKYQVSFSMVSKNISLDRIFTNLRKDCLQQVDELIFVNKKWPNNYIRLFINPFIAW